MGKVTENEESYRESADYLPDSGKADYERRETELIAIGDKMKPLCISIEQIEERRKFLEKSKLMPAVYVLVIAGLAVNFFYEGVYGELQVGTVMMLLGAVAYMAYKYDLRNEGKRAQMLRREEEACLDEWLACGASRGRFEDLRKLYLEEFSIRQPAGRSEAEMAEKRVALEIKLSKFWDDVRSELHGVFPIVR
ncbi:MAG: hypothetical protein BGO99_10550 [Nitrosospira sp. 56-18]|jgi:hypothetical protein|nr:MAG: hypothetical protein BGO99_10550 [Nitrosospira sp. 56-18]